MIIDHQDFVNEAEEFNRDSLPQDPLTLFKSWYQRAEEKLKSDNIINKLTLSTVNAEGRPKSRYVFLRGFENGFLFYTNYQSEKGKEIAQNKMVALTTYWPTLHQQIRIEGGCEKVSAEESDAYFYGRPFLSQVSAAASAQSRPLDNRQTLKNRVQELIQKYQTEQRVPRPAHWGGYRVIPDYYEFWQGRESRLHERVVYRLNQPKNNQWNIELLNP